MLQLVSHRVNSLAALREIPPDCGAEFDVRSRGSRLILNHEPHQDGDSLDNFLELYASSARQGLLVFNPKEDGLESEMLGLIRRFKIESFFFLDLTLPTTVRLAVKERIPAIAVRVSEYEPLEAAARFQGLVNWVWVDCFSGRPPAADLLAQAAVHFKLCLVSPELQGFPREYVQKFLGLAPHLKAVCTKHPDDWRSEEIRA